MDMDVAGSAAIEMVATKLRPSLGARVRSDLGQRALYTSDASLYRVLPGLVVEPVDVEELAQVVAACGEAGVPLTMRGAGTSIAGNAIGAGVVVSTRHLDRIVRIDPGAGMATVEPGVVLDDLNARAAPARPALRRGSSTHSRCTLGGMLGNNACGAHSVAWGTTAQNVLGLDVIRSDGSRVRLVSPEPPGPPRTIPPGRRRRASWPPGLAALVARHEALIRRELPPWPRRVSGYALDWLLPERGD